MSLGGDLVTFDLFDLLQWIGGRRKSGTLRASRRATAKTLGFLDGALVSSTSNDPRETIGQLLVRDGLIDEETLFRALLKQEAGQRRLGEILVGDGSLAPDALLQTLRATAETQLYDLFLWPDGRFEFDDAVRPSGQELAGVQLALGPLLDEGRHRREQWGRLRRRFPSSAVTFHALATPASIADPAARGIVELAGRGKTLAAISLETRRSAYDTALLVADLCDRGVLAADRVADAAPEADPVETIRGLLADAEAAVRGGRFDAALDCYERVLALDRVNQSAKKGLVALAEAREQAKAQRRVPLEKVPALRVTAMALADQSFAPEEGFVLSRVNGEWDVRSILKLCPMAEPQTLLILSRLVERQVIELR